MPALDKLQSDMLRKLIAQEDGGGLGAAPEKNFSIYRNNARLLLRDMLKDTFPVTARLVGDAFFDTVARDYMQAFPPDGGDMTDYGAAFPAFLKRLPGLQNYLYVPDMARLEWAAHAAYLSPLQPPLTTTTLAAAAADPMTLRLFVQPHVFLLRAGWPIADLWQKITEAEGDLPEMALHADESFTAVYRDDNRIAVWSLTEGGYTFLEYLQSNPDFPTAATAALAAEPGFALDRFLGLLVQQGLLCKKMRYGKRTSFRLRRR